MLFWSPSSRHWHEVSVLGHLHTLRISHRIGVRLPLPLTSCPIRIVLCKPEESDPVSHPAPFSLSLPFTSPSLQGSRSDLENVLEDGSLIHIGGTTLVPSTPCPSPPHEPHRRHYFYFFRPIHISSFRFSSPTCSPPPPTSSHWGGGKGAVGKGQRGSWEAGSGEGGQWCSAERGSGAVRRGAVVQCGEGQRGIGEVVGSSGGPWGHGVSSRENELLRGQC